MDFASGTVSTFRPGIVLEVDQTPESFGELSATTSSRQRISTSTHGPAALLMLTSPDPACHTEKPTPPFGFLPSTTV